MHLQRRQEHFILVIQHFGPGPRPSHPGRRACLKSSSGATSQPQYRGLPFGLFQENCSTFTKDVWLPSSKDNSLNGTLAGLQVHFAQIRIRFLFSDDLSKRQLLLDQRSGGPWGPVLSHKQRQIQQFSWSIRDKLQ